MSSSRASFIEKEEEEEEENISCYKTCSPLQAPKERNGRTSKKSNDTILILLKEVNYSQRYEADGY